MAALAGIKVIELSRVLAGPWCGMTLADLGAEVIKLEPLEGDDTRGYGPPFIGHGEDGLSAYFTSCNRGKRAIAMDLRHPQARPLLEALIRDADVLIENFRSGVAESLGLDYPALRALNPRLIHCAISGYGRSGPGAQRPGYDFAVQAESGLMSITGPADGAASKVGVATVDLTTGLNATIAILAALHQRARTGEGQSIELSLFDVQVQALANVAASVLFTGHDARRYGNAHASIVPYQTFDAADGAFALACGSDALWARLCALIERPEWRDDPRCATNAARVEHRGWLIPKLEACFAVDGVAAWLARFESAGIPAAPVNTVREAVFGTLATARGLRIEADGIPMIASPLRMSASPPAEPQRPPHLGEHTDAICAALGFDADTLRTAGAIR
ncbi:CoA transferase [Lysobacter hankyongensis]|uniref:CaiB/BaiF CoA-transferase family protein n=1 Tax=Lysobacter hankyongensis TaxID=1176535 RepID=A0ABP9BBA8_9GAMM